MALPLKKLIEMLNYTKNRLIVVYCEFGKNILQ
jgi:hypothetical protein